MSRLFEISGPGIGEPLECGSVQVENNRARSARSSYRFGNLSWEGYREAFQASFPHPFFPRAVPWAVIVLHLRRARPRISRAGSLRVVAHSGPIQSSISIFVFFVAFVVD